MTLPKMPKLKTEIQHVLAIIATLACFGVTFLLMFHPIPESNKDVINMNLGLIYGGTILLVYGAYFSTNHNKPKKDETTTNP